MPKIWATLQKKVDLDDPVSFIDQEYLGCAQRAAQVSYRMKVERQRQVVRGQGTYKKVGWCCCRHCRRQRRPRRRLSNSVLMVVGGSWQWAVVVFVVVWWWWWRRWWLWWWHLEGGVGRVDQQTAEFINMLVLLLLLVSLFSLSNLLCALCAHIGPHAQAVLCAASRAGRPAPLPCRSLGFGLRRRGCHLARGLARWCGRGGLGSVGWEEN